MANLFPKGLQRAINAALFRRRMTRFGCERKFWHNELVVSPVPNNNVPDEFISSSSRAWGVCGKQHGRAREDNKEIGRRFHKHVGVVGRTCQVPLFSFQTYAFRSCEHVTMRLLVGAQSTEDTC